MSDKQKKKPQNAVSDREQIYMKHGLKTTWVKKTGTRIVTTNKNHAGNDSKKKESGSMTLQEIVEETFSKSGLPVNWVESTSKKKAYVAFPQDEETQTDSFPDKQKKQSNGSSRNREQLYAKLGERPTMVKKTGTRVVATNDPKKTGSKPMTLDEIIAKSCIEHGLPIPRTVEPTSKKKAYVAFPQDEGEEDDPFPDKPKEKLERLCFEERELLADCELLARSLAIADQLGYSQETKVLIEKASHGCWDWIVGNLPSEDVVRRHFERKAKEKNSAAEREAFYASLGPKHNYVKKTGTRIIASNKPKK